ncbi:MAG: hypothetical protein HW421_2876 [Ignavibacteria bacterium]|nr:hypothetical protein [Ignavibacteria bacterium]
MKIFSLYILIFFIVLNEATSKNQDINVINYYAAGNCLDGKPEVGKINLLRFYPVYALRDSTVAVKITIYNGSNVYIREAVKMDEGRYWQSLSPDLPLGSSIHRIDIEVRVRLKSSPLSENYKKMMKAANSKTNALFGFSTSISNGNFYLNSINTNIEKLSMEMKNFDAQNISSLNNYFKFIDNNYHESFGKLNDKIDDMLLIADKRFTEIAKQKEIPDTLDSHTSADNIESAIPKEEVRRFKAEWEEIRNTLKSSQSSFEQYSIVNSDKFEQITKLIGEINKKLDEANAANNSIRDIFAAAAKDGKETISIDNKKLAGYTDTLKAELLREIEKETIDTNVIGPPIKRSDIILDDTLSEVKILYKNYNTATKTYPQLEPRENLGIFRFRLIPIAIIGQNLHKSLSGMSSVVMEVGLSFGNQSIISNNLFSPEFLVERFGVSLAFNLAAVQGKTEVFALAFTYDFNSIVSIGIGVNYPSGSNISQGYFSIGINKRAFEALFWEAGKAF